MTYVINLLMRQPPIVLQYIPVLRSACTRQFLDDWQDLAEVLVWDVGEGAAVIFGYY